MSNNQAGHTHHHRPGRALRPLSSTWTSLQPARRPSTQQELTRVPTTTVALGTCPRATFRDKPPPRCARNWRWSHQRACRRRGQRAFEAAAALAGKPTGTYFAATGRRPRSPPALARSRRRGPGPAAPGRRRRGGRDPRRGARVPAARVYIRQYLIQLPPDQAGSEQEPI